MLSEKVPTAVNCCSTPNGIVFVAGVTAIDVSVALVTVSVAVPDMELEAAVIVVVPAAKPIAVPFVGTISLTVATLVEDEVQLTLLVTSFILPSAKVPMAVKEVAVVAAIDFVAGLTAMPVKGGAGTVSVVDPLTLPDLAVMVVVPAATVVANPLALMVAVAAVEDVHVAEAVKSLLVPSE